jgi:hypothetical protein
VKDLCELVDRFERRGVALISVAESFGYCRSRGLHNNHERSK